MKNVYLISLFSVGLAPAIGFAGNAASTTYQCYQAGTSQAIAKIELANETNAAAIHTESQSFQGTYQEQKGQCPSRLCGSSILNIKTSVSKAPYGGIHKVTAYFTNSGGTSDLTGSFGLYDIGGRAPQTIEAYCKL